MKLEELQDYAFCEKATVLNSRQPLKHIKVCVVSTKNFVFYLPKQTMGIYAVVQTFKTHSLFNGVSVEEGAKSLIGKAESVDELEKSFIALLENNNLYVHRFSDYKTVKFSGFFGQQTLRLAKERTKWSSVTIKGKDGKAFRNFLGK